MKRKKEGNHVTTRWLFALLILFLLPASALSFIQGGFLSLTSPFPSLISSARVRISHAFKTLISDDYERLVKIAEESALAELQAREQVERLQELLKQERLHRGLEDLNSEVVPSLKGAMAASVIFRSPDRSNHFIWIDLGSKDNTDPDHLFISRDSPVVKGDALVGIVDYVGRRTSRVRLLTDAKMNPAVRVARGGAEQRALFLAVDQLLDLLPEGQTKLAADLEQFRCRFLPPSATFYSAKGELNGTGSKLWKRGELLEGSGFNYEFPDKQGAYTGGELIKKGDLLVTSGLDGVFPLGLRTAIVVEVEPLQEGCCTYKIRARPVVENIDSLSIVFVLAPHKEQGSQR